MRPSSRSTSERWKRRCTRGEPDENDTSVNEVSYPGYHRVRFWQVEYGSVEQVEYGSGRFNAKFPPCDLGQERIWVTHIGLVSESGKSVLFWGKLARPVLVEPGIGPVSVFHLNEDDGDPP